MSFLLSGLPIESFRPLLALTNHELSLTQPGNDYPCRITLEVARPGEGVLLLSCPDPAGIFVREAAEAPYVGYDEIPAQIAPRLMPVDARHYIVAADVTPGAQLGELAERLF
jgi:hypothetical protein